MRDTLWGSRLSHYSCWVMRLRLPLELRTPPLKTTLHAPCAFRTLALVIVGCAAVVMLNPYEYRDVYVPSADAAIASYAELHR